MGCNSSSALAKMGATETSTTFYEAHKNDGNVLVLRRDYDAIKSEIVSTALNGMLGDKRVVIASVDGIISSYVPTVRMQIPCCGLDNECCMSPMIGH